MKTKASLIFVLFTLIYSKSFAQLKVENNGCIGIGIDNSGAYKVGIKGNLLLTTWPEIPVPLTHHAELFFKVGNGAPGSEFGSNVGEIAVWSSWPGWNVLDAGGFYTASDSTLKTNIIPIKSGLETILKLNSYSYNLKSDTERSKKKYGFLAQEIEKILPDITETAKGNKLVDYQQVIPILVEAIKEQQKNIDSLKRDLNNAKIEMIDCCNQNHNNGAQNIINENINKSNNNFKGTSSIAGNSKLYQNKPNPFSVETIIEFEIIENFSNASIMIFDMQGALKKTVTINHNGKGQVTINGNSLIAGMYLYSLIVDDNEIDTKRMILQ